MPKKKKAATKPAKAPKVTPLLKNLVEAGVAVSSTTPVTVDSPPLDDEPIDAGTWRGHPNYGCPWCDYASLDEGAVRLHMRQHVLVDRA